MTAEETPYCRREEDDCGYYFWVFPSHAPLYTTEGRLDS
jgi:hypothetical protein